MALRTSTLLAVTAGALFGAIAAWVTSSPVPATVTTPPPGAQEPFAPVGGTRVGSARGSNQPRSARAPAAVGSGASSHPSATPPTAAQPVASAGTGRHPAPRWESEPGPENQPALAQAELRCARGNSEDCMRVGIAYDRGRGVEADPKQARDFFSQARRRYSARC